jgi:hypothetical protein
MERSRESITRFFSDRKHLIFALEPGKQFFSRFFGDFQVVFMLFINEMWARRMLVDQAPCIIDYKNREILYQSPSLSVLSELRTQKSSLDAWQYAHLLLIEL